VLLACYVGFRLGLVGGDGVGREDLQARLGKSGKITSTRLGELVKSDVVVKTADDKYRITTFGIVQMQKDNTSENKSKDWATKLIFFWCSAWLDPFMD